MYDVIGDVHGHAKELEELLRQLGYMQRRGSWSFPGKRRQAIFLGDLIDRGPDSPGVVNIVRAMVERESALVVMGNHEYNAIAWHTTDDAGNPLRAHSEAHRKQHQTTLDAYRNDSHRLLRDITWMRSLPLYFENEVLRVVHATWDPHSLAALQRIGAPEVAPLQSRHFLLQSARRGTIEHQIIETLLKGLEAPLPRGVIYHDKEGTRRTKTRLRWWLDLSDIAEEEAVPLGTVAMPPVDSRMGEIPLPRRELSLPGYHDHRPVFLGHYWLTDTPTPLAPQVACVDYSVAAGGSLCAYRFDGETTLQADHFHCIPGPAIS